MSDDAASDNESSSDEEIKSLKEKLRDRRWTRRMEKQRKDVSAFSDVSDNNTTGKSSTGKSSSFKTSSTLSSSLGTGSSKDEGTLNYMIHNNIMTYQMEFLPRLKCSVFWEVNANRSTQQGSLEPDKNFAPWSELNKLIKLKQYLL